MAIDRLIKPSLYDPKLEHDACGVGFVARVSGTQDHPLLQLTLEALSNVTHRGAVSADGKSGDGAGILTQPPRRFVLREANKLGARVSDIRDVVVGMFNLPQDQAASETARQLSQAILGEHNLRFLGWREVPVDNNALGGKAYQTRPDIRQAFVLKPEGMESKVFQKQVYKARKAIEKAAEETGLDIYIPSFDQQTLVYKGLMIAGQLPVFYKDLQDPNFETALAIFHQRYSTNTTPDWMRAQPFRFLAHNGEINTLQGGVNWTRATESQLPPELVPVIWEAGSDSAKLDNVLELLVKSGRDVPHALMMLVQAASNYPDSDPKTREFYKYHGLLTPPWDGPAALAFSDGKVGGVISDRMGLRPLRYKVTEDGLVIAGSEVGIVRLDESLVVESGMLGPGQVFLVDTAGYKILRDGDVKATYTSREPYPGMSYEDINRGVLVPVARDSIEDPAVSHNGHEKILATDLSSLQRAFGFTHEDVRVIIQEMAEKGSDAVFSMGDDTPPAVLSNLNRTFYAYFKQLFAQVTNPPIDSTREYQMMSLETTLGPMPDMLGEVPLESRILSLKSPILDSKQVEEIAGIKEGPLRAVTIDTTFDPSLGPDALKDALIKLNAKVEAAARAGAGNIILSDEGVDSTHVPIPMLLALGGVHHHLIREGVRTKTSLVVKTGEAWDVHHFAALIGYGANAINPYLAVTTSKDLVYQEYANRIRIAETKMKHGQPWKETPEDVKKELFSLAYEKATDSEQKYFQAIEKGLLKVMAKMGIPTIAGYRGAQIFEALGINSEVVNLCFSGTPTRIGGLGFEEIAEDALARHAEAFSPEFKKLPNQGLVRPVREYGEYHANNRKVVEALQKAANSGLREDFQAYIDLVEGRSVAALRDLMEFNSDRLPIPLAEVEPMERIRQRFITTAMSLGALGPEAHRVLAVAMNRIGGRSNSGEGGENPANYVPDANGDLGHNKIKQIASARFGVTAEYLMQAQEIEIKMAQGSKPGEGGQIPGSKVTELIASLRFAVPGVGLISPPPHHDIYSIEDLAQLIYDLKMINPKAKIGVKLVSEPGVGTIAAGVAKAYADYILVSGADGGTGASPLSSIKNAGSPWELGLAETQQTLAGERLRERVKLRTDGGLKTGRDVVIAAMLGAEEYGFGTQAVIAIGCDMARACHLNTCPTGIATQDPKYRENFTGTPEQVINYFTLVAENVRGILAQLGYPSLDEIIGRSELLRRRESRVGSRESLIDISSIIMASDSSLPRIHMIERNDRPEDKIPLGVTIAEDARKAVMTGLPVHLSYKITNSDRTVGSRLAGEIASLHGSAGLEPGTVTIDLEGSAGQSLGAWLARGVTLKVVGEANDYAGKGLSGGELIIYPSSKILYEWNQNVIAGNTVLYGATGGEFFAAGRVGERFAIRNSGATAVAEGAGDNACEYMTGGMVAILGRVGNNFGAGMTGGVAYIPASDRNKINPELVEALALDDSDRQVLIRLVGEHFDKTGSPTALEILNNLDSLVGNFVRVSPKNKPNIHLQVNGGVTGASFHSIGLAQVLLPN